jgi:hypothetical protein
MDQVKMNMTEGVTKNDILIVNEKNPKWSMRYERYRSWSVELFILAVSLVGFIVEYAHGSYGSALAWCTILFWQYAWVRSEWQTWWFLKHTFKHDVPWRAGLDLPKNWKGAP